MTDFLEALKKPFVALFIWIWVRRLTKTIREANLGARMRVWGHATNGTKLIAILLWVVVVFNGIWSWTSSFEFSTFAVLLSALLLVLITGAVNVMDKPLPRFLMTWHASLSTAAFLAIPLVKGVRPWIFPALEAASHWL